MWSLFALKMCGRTPILQHLLEAERVVGSTNTPSASGSKTGPTLPHSAPLICDSPTIDSSSQISHIVGIFWQALPKIVKKKERMVRLNPRAHFQSLRWGPHTDMVSPTRGTLVLWPDYASCSHLLTSSIFSPVQSSFSLVTSLYLSMPSTAHHLHRDAMLHKLSNVERTVKRSSRKICHAAEGYSIMLGGFGRQFRRAYQSSFLLELRPTSNAYKPPRTVAIISTLANKIYRVQKSVDFLGDTSIIFFFLTKIA
ncbi:uncharacterized protein BDR25DRAFT_355671 [Lindgomyces ingoldianus]|uniref:Uncharacterized protein n=1 Tax=Lindgomyces ingoldianus TaxID=673940 RepID=A0ACB6QST1_9PLEO|nr:uncharacterized protein BDR25DRAFT_355671 [Lindgomyces ingoldianus]KAF2469946.1 hypothetical protein BDR25DRAFT_355671 [Lindgomyces ingoldianus]